MDGQFISQGLGAPADIPTFLLLGLSIGTPPADLWATPDPQPPATSAYGAVPPEGASS